MNLLVSNIDALLHFTRNGHLRISYTFVIGICIIVLILFIFLIIALFEKRMQIKRIKKELMLKQNRINEINTDSEQRSRRQKAQISDLKKELKDTTLRLEQSIKRIEVLNQSVSEKSDEINVLLNEKKFLEIALGKTEKALKDTDGALKKVTEKIGIRRQELITAKSEISSLNDELSKSKEIVSSLKQEIEAMNKLKTTSNPFERLVNW